MVYVTSDRSHSLYVIDGTTNLVLQNFTVQIPCGVALNPNTNLIYVTSEATDKVHVINGSNNKLVTMIDVDKSPRGVIVNPNTNLVYVTNQGSDNISVIDGTENKVIDTIDVGKTPRRVVVNPDNNRIYVSNHFSDNVSIIDSTTNSIVESVTVVKPFEMAINTKTDTVYVTYSESGPLSIISESVKVQDLIQLNSIMMTVIILVAAGILASIFVSRRKAQRLN